MRVKKWEVGNKVATDMAVPGYVTDWSGFHTEFGGGEEGGLKKTHPEV